MSLILASILGGSVAAAGGGFWYLNNRKKQLTGKSIVDSWGEEEDKTQPIHRVIRSRYFPDDIYVAKGLRLDPSLKAMMYGQKIMFAFPEHDLTVKAIRYFAIQGNVLEEIEMETVGKDRFTIIYDDFEKVMYLLNHLTTQAIERSELPAPARLDTISMVEGGEEYEFLDDTGLIDVTVTNHDGEFVENRQVRLYKRLASPEYAEFLFTFIKPRAQVVSYFSAFNIHKSQLT